MNTTQRKRLLKLAAFLRTVPRKRFQMNTWATGPLNACGTAGCAIGWASVLFKRVAEPRLRLISVMWNNEAVLVPECEEKNYLGAAMKFFGIEYEDAVYLFSNAGGANGGATPGYVAKKIEKFVKECSK